MSESESEAEAGDERKGKRSSNLTLRDEVETTPLDSIHPYGENPKEHPASQVDKIASSIRRFGWDQPIVIDGEGEIIKGHGRYQAAQKLGLDEVPVIRAPDLTEAEVRAARIADNRVAESDWDDDLLAVELELLNEASFDTALTGFEDDEIEAYLNQPDPDLDSDGDLYTDRIESPVYQPSGDEPPLSDLYDEDRADELLALVDEADVPEDVREFLRFAAYRHIVFDYENIAEFYAHQDAETQELMEALTLVIVDFDQAVEQGFIDFTLDSLGSEVDAADELDRATREPEPQSNGGGTDD